MMMELPYRLLRFEGNQVQRDREYAQLNDFGVSTSAPAAETHQTFSSSPTLTTENDDNFPASNKNNSEQLHRSGLPKLR